MLLLSQVILYCNIYRLVALTLNNGQSMEQQCRLDHLAPALLRILNYFFILPSVGNFNAQLYNWTWRRVGSSHSLMV